MSATGVERPQDGGRFVDVRGEGRRGRAARGTLINTAFLIGLNALAVVRGFVVAGFVTLGDYGIWGMLIVAFTTLYGLVQIGVSDKYIQQDADDQERAFQQAFTLQLILSGTFVVVMWVAMPLFALAYGTWEILLPGWVLTAAMPASAFQTPIMTFYRRLDYMRQRRLQALDPVAAMVVSIALAAAGLGYWAFVIGTLCGAWLAAAAAVRASPYRLRWSYEKGTVREYRTFSAPLMFAGVCTAVMTLAPVLTAQRTLGAAAVGAMAVASSISQYSGKVDQLVNRTLYPVVCSVKERRELLQEAFLKTNRVGLLWAAPFGLGVALFASDLVHHVMGSRWAPAIPVIQAFAAIAVMNQIGFSWTSIFRALAMTRPLAVAALAMTVAVTGIAVPLMLVAGLEGYSVGMALAVACLVAVRLGYLRRLFPLRSIIVNTARGVAPALGAVAAIVAVRLAIDGGARTGAAAAAEVALYVALVTTITLLAERRLLAEFRGYLRRGRRAAAASPGPA